MDDAKNPVKNFEPDWDFELIATRVRHRREELGLTLEEVARATGVTRQTLSRIEKGLPSLPATLNKLRARLKLFTDQLVRQPVESSNYRVHRKERTRWLVSLPKRSYSKVEEGQDPRHVDDVRERHRLGQLGFQPFFTSILESELPDGASGQALMELHRPSWADSHYGEEFVYCLRGSVKITVGGDTCVLEEGDAMTFDAWNPHVYAPAKEVGPGDLAPLILLVVIARHKDQEMRKAHFIKHPQRPDEVSQEIRYEGQEASK